MQSARAAWDDCTGLTVTTGGDLTLDVTADTCSLTNTFPGTNNYINFNAGSGSSVTIDLIGIDDPAGDFSSISIVHDGGTDNITDGSSFGQANDFSNTYNCSAGCIVSGNYSAAPISGAFSVTYTQNAGSGSLGAATSPEISVSADIGGAVTDGGTNAQGSRTAGSATTVTYTVTNTGTGDLTIATATSSSLSNVTVNSIGAPGSTTVTNGGGTTTFTVQYTPTLAGAFSFNVSFVNDDGDENPFNFTVSGTATGTPEISVSADIGGAVSDGGTNAQGSQTAGSATTVTYTVSNTGTDDLTIATATSSSLSNVTVNSIGAPGSTTVTGGGGTTTFTVQYTPTLAGAFSFNVSFVNDDGDENPFNFTVSGTATGTPEISVSADIGGAVSDGGTNAQGSRTAGSATTVTYTVSNTGTDDLTIATATSSSTTNVTVNSIGAPGSTTVANSGGTTTFTVQYTPTLAGAFSFDVSFVNDDGDENPFNFTVSGTATGTPEISVSADIGGAVSDGGTNAQGSRAAGSATTVTYTVSNTGTGDLTIATATSSSLSNVTVNSIGAPGSTTVTGGGGTTTFTVQYTPTLAGAFSFNVSFVNDDSDENPFNFTVSGTGSGNPEISVSADIGGAVTDGGTNAQGSQTAGSAVTVTYTVSNTGTDDLTIATATSSAASNVTVNSVGAPGSTTVAGGGSTTTFAVQYTPTLAGAFSFNLSFVNDDGDENPFNFTVSGTATGTPEISVSADIGGAVTDGGTNAQGNQAVASATTVTYTVSNTGTDDLTIATATSSSLSNVTVNSIGAPGSTTVTGGGGTTTFTVQYTPTLAGAFSFDVSFVNDDGDENPFNFTVSGTGVGAPEISVSADIGGAVSDGGTNAQGSRTAGSAVTVTYTVSNTGTDDLTIATATSSSLSNVTVNSIGAPGSTTVASSGGTTTFTVQYTPTLAGAFSFDVSFVNDDGDENPFNFTVSGTATGEPEISVSADIGGAVSDGGTNAQGSQTAGSAVTVTYTVSNTGTDDLTIATATSSAASNVTVNSVGAPGSTTVAGGGSTTTFAVQYTPTLAGAFSFNLSFVNDDGDENPFNFTVSGSASVGASTLVATSGSGQAAEIETQFDNVLVATVTDGGGNGVAGVDVTFTAPSTGASLTFAATGTRTQTVTSAADGTVTSSVMTANDTASSYLRGGALESYSVTASATGLTSVSFSLTNDRDAEADIQKTKEVIASFVTSRANAIVSGQPDLVSRLTGGPFGRQSGSNGLNFDVTPYSQSGNFQFSLRAFANALRADNRGDGAGQAMASVDRSVQPQAVGPEDRYASFNNFNTSGTMSYTAVAPTTAPQDTLAILSGTEGEGAGGAAQDTRSGWDFWAQGSYAITENNDSDSQTGLVFAGVDYRYKDRAVFGIMGQLDITDETNASENTSADGVGWMAGPYAVVRVHQNFYLDGVFTYGQSYNSVDALGLFEDDFRTQRFLLQGGLTGDFKVDKHTRVSPFVRLTYYYEEQESYTDTLGRLIPSQDFDLGRIEFGPKISWDLMLDDSILFSPFLSLSGIYDFNKLQDDSPSDATLASSDQDLRARLEAGAGFLIPSRNIRISGEGFFDGIGASDFRSYGATVSVTIPF
ncbi:choice-of-anchor D domain-containing protein [Labrenzia sp. OB1]|uniref:choice-of-anchor D domain-containing protein n=1 Tax=Labrenzia sp. OB1 TaxID=1561204 RepID=UPI0018FEDD20|nr:choice-of-anchor D domain-containing protein [Labrenzia sp. OB1]